MDFTGFDDFLALTRVTGLAASSDGARLVAALAEYDEEAGRFVSALWELDPDGDAEPVRLTRSAKGESQPVFEPDGSLLFVSGRQGDGASLWRLPLRGEAAEVLTRPGGVSGVKVAAAGTVVVSTSMLPGATDAASDEVLRKARKNVGAILHTASPVSSGVEETRLQVLTADEPKDLVPEPGRALASTAFAVTPDGKTVIAQWGVPFPGWPQIQLVAISIESGERRVLATAAEAGFYEPAVSPDGRYVVGVCWRDPAPEKAPDVWLVLIDLATGEQRELVTEPGLWPSEPAFAADGASIYFLADHHGSRALFQVDVESAEVSQLTTNGTYSNLQVGPDRLFAIRNHVDSPPVPVRIDPASGEYKALLPQLTMQGVLERVETVATDGTTIEGWLVRPETTEPAPLLLWIHGGPLGSWAGWAWRWNPWLMAAKGYAVLLPDPALSTGYGAEMIERGWLGWGATVYDDLMAITDTITARPDIDADRVAAMGGSFGGYMINWIAGRTDRFRCLVNHAGLWDLTLQATSDLPGYFVKEQGSPEEYADRYAERSPRRFLKAISTPMLITHGGQDPRVPVGHALYLWSDLQRSGVESAYLAFPDEGHLILKPANARLWYETIWSWLAHHVLDEPWAKPELLDS